MNKGIRYKGVRPAEIITVLEGDGTPEDPFTEVQYVIGYVEVNGLFRTKTLGKIIPVEINPPTI